LIELLTTLLAGYLLICLLASLFQRNLTYFPMWWDEQTARRANPGYEEVRFATADGEMLHGWLRRDSAAPWTVILFHGNGGNLAVQDATMIPHVRLRLQVLLFDYRGYGLSTGRPTEKGLIRDGEAAARFVEESLGVPRERIVYHGKSLGSGVAVLTARDRPPARLILESAYDSLVAVARHHYFYLPVGWLLRDRFDAGSAISGIGRPVLFLHPGADEIIPVRFGRALFDKTPEPKRFVVIPGAHHNDPPDTFGPGYLDAIRDFLDLPRDPATSAAEPGGSGASR
jgi:hypothetical protein